MIARLRQDQSGFTLIEVLIAASLMLVVLSATLLAFNSAANNARGNAVQNDQEAQVRPPMDRLVAQLRNLANPTTNVPSINYADGYRMVFLTTDPTKRWVSYCLDRASKTNENLWYQTSTANTITQQSSTTACPSDTPNGTKTDWASTIKLTGNVTNDNPTTGRPLFTYLGSGGGITVPAGGLTATSTPSSQTITRVQASIYLDTNALAPPALDKSPAEISLQSGAFLRNQNQPPTAKFIALRGSGNSFTLNGSDSVDPEGRNLQYYWYETATKPTSSSQFPTNTLTDLPDCDTSNKSTFNGLDWKCLGTGVILAHDFTSDLPTNIWLRVIDPGNLVSLSAQPSAFGDCPSVSGTTRTEDQCATLP